MVKLVFLLTPALALAYSYGPDPRYTAAPGDHPMACASVGCHTSTGSQTGGPINAAGGGVTATFSSGSSYTPGGAAITITVSVSDSNKRFGFQMTARLDSDQTNGQAGDFNYPSGAPMVVLCDDGNGSVKPPGKPCVVAGSVEFIEHSFQSASQVTTTPYTFTWTPPATNVGPVHFYVAGNAVNGNGAADSGDHVYTASYVLTPAGSTAAPVLTSGSVANGATYVAGGLVPGSWAQVKGTGLSNTTRIWASADFNGLGNNLPTNLSGVQVTVNNLPAAIYYIDSGQVSFQVPNGISGTASVQVINNGAASNTVTGAAASSSPGIFPIIVNGTNYPAAVFATDSKLAGDPSVSGFRKATPGEAVQLYATGLAVTPAGVLPGSQGVNGVTVTIGSTTVNPDFAGLVAVGEFQINFKVPNLAAGSYPISITVGGVSSPATIDSNPPGPIMLLIGP